MDLPIENGVFHSYVSLPEGSYVDTPKFSVCWAYSSYKKSPLYPHKKKKKNSFPTSILASGNQTWQYPRTEWTFYFWKHHPLKAESSATVGQRNPVITSWKAIQSSGFLPSTVVYWRGIPWFIKPLAWKNHPKLVVDRIALAHPQYVWLLEANRYIFHIEADGHIFHWRIIEPEQRWLIPNLLDGKESKFGVVKACWIPMFGG